MLGNRPRPGTAGSATALANGGTVCCSTAFHTLALPGHACPISNLITFLPAHACSTQLLPISCDKYDEIEMPSGALGL